MDTPLSCESLAKQSCGAVAPQTYTLFLFFFKSKNKRDEEAFAGSLSGCELVFTKLFAIKKRWSLIGMFGECDEELTVQWWLAAYGEALHLVPLAF